MSRSLVSLCVALVACQAPPAPAEEESGTLDGLVRDLVGEAEQRIHI